MSDTFHLAHLGFSEQHRQAGVFFQGPDGRTMSAAHPYARFRALNGRLDNLAYMARAIDRLDGVSEPAAGTATGDHQFHHLIDYHREAAAAYFALRRVQRTGDASRLRVGLSLLLAYEDSQITIEDLLSSLLGDLPAGQAQLPKTIALPAAPGPVG